jgi:hypothetical protein
VTVVSGDDDAKLQENLKIVTTCTDSTRKNCKSYLHNSIILMQIAGGLTDEKQIAAKMQKCTNEKDPDFVWKIVERIVDELLV